MQEVKYLVNDKSERFLDKNLSYELGESYLYMTQLQIGKYTFALYGNNNFEYTLYPYFFVYKYENGEIKGIRISCVVAKYIIPHDSKTIWILNEEEKKEIVPIIQQIWDSYIIDNLKGEGIIKENSSFDIPDYSKLPKEVDFADDFVDDLEPVIDIVKEMYKEEYNNIYMVFPSFVYEFGLWCFTAKISETSYSPIIRVIKWIKEPTPHFIYVDIDTERKTYNLAYELNRPWEPSRKEERILKWFLNNDKLGKHLLQLSKPIKN